MIAVKQYLPVALLLSPLLPAVAFTWVARRALPATPAGFATGMALITFALFVCGKKAFCNYYFFVIGALAVAIAASGGEEKHA